MGEGRGLVPFEGEMAGPGEAVGDDRHDQEKPGIAGRDRRRENDGDERAADHMHPPAVRVAVLAEIEEIEFREAREGFFGRLGGLGLDGGSFAGRTRHRIWLSWPFQ